jgi:copper chaperone
LDIEDCAQVPAPNIQYLKSIETEGAREMKTVTLSIPNISCNHCIMTVKRESGFVDGAEFVSGDVEGKTATFQVAGDEALQALKEALAEAGYPVAS